MTSMAVADDGVAVDVLTLFSYPLHPPGKPERARTEHLPRIAAPTVFTHGTADPFGTIDELRAAAALIPAPTEIVEVTGARHDLGSKTSMFPRWRSTRRYVCWRDCASERPGGTKAGLSPLSSWDPRRTMLSVIFAIVALVQMRPSTNWRGWRSRHCLSAAWIAIITSLIAYGISAQGKTVQAIDLNTGDCVKMPRERASNVSEAGALRPATLRRSVRGPRGAHPVTSASPQDCGPKSRLRAEFAGGPVPVLATRQPPGQTAAGLSYAWRSTHERWSSLRH